MQAARGPLALGGMAGQARGRLTQLRQQPNETAE